MTIIKKEWNKIKRIIRMSNAKKEVKHLKKTGIPRCPICKKDMKKIEEESGKYNSVWESNCEHGKNLKLSMG